MEDIRKEIRDEMQSLRINKKHIYDVLMRLVDEIDRTPSQSTPEPVEEAAPEPVEEATPEPVEEVAPEPVEAAAPEQPPVKKVVRRVRKKVEGEEAVLR